ncbi:proclotting enzyme-like [Ornithodoros turicata]|uniref:proclotting enzyme-like n=1 Tax=Ornithodoros turicata TaxID=34597 RepID=UPI0031398AE7
MGTAKYRIRSFAASFFLLVLCIVPSGVCGAEACRARHPKSGGAVDGECLPLLRCTRSLRGILRLKFPRFCKARGLVPIVCCPRMTQMQDAKRLSVATASSTTPRPTTTPSGTTLPKSSTLDSSRTTSESGVRPCESVGGVHGLCVPSKTCDYEQRRPREEHLPTLCDFRHGTTYICCPLNATEQTAGRYSEDDLRISRLSDVVLNENRRYCGKAVPRLVRRAAMFVRPAVIRGRNVKLGKYKFAVAIFHEGSHERNFWCGGVLITDRVVLSAAHCFHDKLNDTRFMALVGGVSIEQSQHQKESYERRVQSIHIHPTYDKRRFYGDVALLVLDTAVPIRAIQAPAACLPEKGAEPGADRAIVLGWGHDMFGGRLQTHLQEGEVPIVDTNRCDKIYQGLSNYERIFPRGVEESFVCAGNLTSKGADACQQDSGGPLVIEASANDRIFWELAGIVSFGVGCGSSDFPGVYSRVSTFLPWILRTISEHAFPGATLI